MRKLFLVLIVMALSLESYAQNSEPKKYKNEFRVGMGQLMLGRFNFNYERKFEKSSFVLVGEVQSMVTNKKQTNGGMGEIQFRKYLSPSANPLSDGIYIGVFASYRYSNIVTSTSDTEMKRPGAGVFLGSKFALADVLILDIYAGGIYTYALEGESIITNDFSEYMFSPGYYGVRPVLNVTLGLEF